MSVLWSEARPTEDGADVVIQSDLLSRIHLELAKQAPHFHHDVAATNGIVVRGSQVYNVLLAAQIAQNGDEPYQGERHPRNPPVLQLHTLRQRLQPLDPDDYALELYGLLRPPDELINGFVEAAGMQHRAFEQNGIPLPLLADAFVRHFRSSTAHARDGASPYSTPVPPHAQYVGLVKCAWLMENILRGTDFTNRTRDPNSHWPSYVRQLLEVRRLAEGTCLCVRGRTNLLCEEPTRKV